MPIYEYYCKKCLSKFELLNATYNSKSIPCPKCGTISSKIISATNYTFGWELSEKSHESFGPRDEFVKAV